MLSVMIFSELILEWLWSVFQYVEQLLQNGQYLEFYIGKSVERLFMPIAKVSTILDKITWENVFINAHYLTQQNYSQINGFA